MLTSLPVAILISSLLGFMTALGVGGGSLLILWLTAIIGMDSSMARCINLLFFVPSALISCLFRWHRKQLSIQHIAPAAIFGCIAAAIATYCSGFFDANLLRKLFGILLLGIGFRELFYRPEKRK